MNKNSSNYTRTVMSSAIIGEYKRADNLMFAAHVYNSGHYSK